MTAPFHPAAAQLASSHWTLDPSASRVEFTVRQFWGRSTVRGRFTTFEGELYFSSEGAGRAMLYIEAASVHTGNRRRDRHLRAPDYFDCERHSQVRFVADVGTARGGAGLTLTGELSAGGRSIALDLEALADGGDDTLTLSAGTDLDARELGMTWAPIGRATTPVTLTVCAHLRRVG